MRIAAYFMAFCFLKILGLMGQTTSPGDLLMTMIVAIQPSFSEGLVHLSSLFDLVMNYDETTSNGLVNNDTASAIQAAIHSASNSFNDTEALTIQHMKMYEVSLLALTTDITAKEVELRSEDIKLGQLQLEVAMWQRQAYALGREIAELDEKIRDADKRAAQSNARAQKKRKNRWKWIVATVFTVGLATPGLVINENDIKKLKRDRDAWQKQAKQRRQVLVMAETNLRTIAARQRSIEISMQTTRTSLTSAQAILKGLKTQYAILSGLGAQIRNVSTFLVSLNGEMGVVHNQHQLMVLFRPLLKSVDSLLNVLEGNANTLVQIGDEEAVSKIRHHLSHDVIPTLEIG